MRIYISKFIFILSFWSIYLSKNRMHFHEHRKIKLSSLISNSNPYQETTLEHPSNINCVTEVHTQHSPIERVVPCLPWFIQRRVIDMLLYSGPAESVLGNLEEPVSEGRLTIAPRVTYRVLWWYQPHPQVYWEPRFPIENNGETKCQNGLELIGEAHHCWPTSAVYKIGSMRIGTHSKYHFDKSSHSTFWHVITFHSQH